MLTQVAQTSLAATLETRRQEVDAMCATVRAVPIESQGDLDELGEAVREAKACFAQLDAARKTLIVEYDPYVRRVNEYYRAPLRAYKALEDAIKDRIARHVRETQSAARALQERAGEAFRAGQTQAAHAALAAVHSPAATAGVAVREYWDAEIVDPSQVPAEFWIIDTDAIWARVVKTNGAPIPGVRIFKSQTVAVRMK